MRSHVFIWTLESYVYETKIKIFMNFLDGAKVIKFRLITIPFLLLLFMVIIMTII